MQEGMRKSFLPYVFNDDEKDLEHAMFLTEPHQLSSKDVYKTLRNHIKKYQ
jgi:hypothetical protein